MKGKRLRETRGSLETRFCSHQVTLHDIVRVRVTRGYIRERTKA